MTLTAKTYGDGRGMITSAWLPTKWFVIASAILNSNTTVITLIVTPCVHWGVQNNIIKTGTLSIMADVCAKWVVVITLVVPLLPNYFITSCVPGVEARAACLHHTHTHCRLTTQARFLLLFSFSLALVSAAEIPGCCSVCCRWHQHQCEGRQCSTTLWLLFALHTLVCRPGHYYF